MDELRARWKLRDVFAVYFLRLACGLLLVRYIFPSTWSTSAWVVELADRLVVLGLVYIVVRREGSSWQEIGVKSKKWGLQIGWGLLVGILLLGVSIYSEKVFTTLLFVSPSQHPLVSLVEAAYSWQDLVVPLFLAGFAAPITEEVLYRMFTFLPLTKRFGVTLGSLGSAVIFAAMHFSIFWLAEMVVVGVGLALLYYKTQSLVSAVVAHSFINTSKILMIFLGIPLV
ncbi:membrane protease YdiL (CAAX protease family) [Sporomusaceae bacterium BoRhaA]|uniref:CPBP family intramembrane glutamic endopeptidase n=1 Tax=Pelorhabdus rhamnosifermentans TaxID=2772457 RepID=UPI001C06336C|nr:type II CAAX endopeptidase family protein [Pelorhabdus rhamnosifermentans]MBU2702688.1 membrane protease YdiL (CAAX protease family) [Pelorhabdus rhamnosifermentans]